MCCGFDFDSVLFSGNMTQSKRKKFQPLKWKMFKI
jgi:hypothetical protein